MGRWIVVVAAGALLAVQPAAAQTPPAASPSQPALQLMLQKGVITQAEYDAALKQSAEAVIQKDTTVVVKETPRIDAPPVTSKWTASMYGFIEADFIYDSTQSFNDAAGNTIVQANGYAAKNHRLQFSIRNTRLGFRFGAPEWGSVRSTAVLEMDFYGNQPANPPTLAEGSFFNSPGFRIRHAYLKLETPIVDLLFGQTWELFGWQTYFHPNSVQVQGLPGQAFARTVQARVSKTIRTEPVTVDVAVAASRPPQRDAYVPDFQGGVRIAVNGWKAITTAGSAVTSILPAALGVSGTWRRFQVEEPTAALGNPGASAVTTGWGYSVDLLLPIVPVRSGDRGNGLTLTASFVNGAGISDLFTSLSGGLGGAASTPGLTPVSGYVPAVDAGLVMFGTDGSLNAIRWRAFIVGLQYYLPPSGRVWVSVNYSDMYSSNIAGYANPASVFERSHFADANVFWDATNAVRLGLEYAWFRQYRANGDAATDHRVQLSTFFLF